MDLFESRADVIDFDNGPKQHLGATIMNLALLGFLCSLGIQYIEGKHWFSSLTFGWKFPKIKLE